jgi:hypothetical protein
MAADDLILDLTNYKDTQGDYVNPGTYTAVIEDAEIGKSSQKQTPQLQVWLRIVGGEFDGSNLVEQLYLTEGSTFRVVAFLRALGIKTPKGVLRLKLRSIINRRVDVVVIDNEYNNKVRSRVDEYRKYVKPAGEGASGDLDFSEFEGDGTSTEVDDLPDDLGGEAALEEESAEAPELVQAAPAISGDDTQDEPAAVEPEPEADPEPVAEAPKAAAPKASAPKEAPAAETDPDDPGPDAEDSGSITTFSDDDDEGIELDNLEL